MARLGRSGAGVYVGAQALVAAIGDASGAHALAVRYDRVRVVRAGTNGAFGTESPHKLARAAATITLGVAAQTVVDLTTSGVAGGRDIATP